MPSSYFVLLFLGISHVGKTLKNFMQLGYFIARLYSNIYAFFTLTYTRECANKLQVLIRTRYTGVIAFNGPVSLCFFSGSEFSLVAFHPRNANALLFHFSLCYRCKNKVHRSFNQAEKSYHDGRHSFLLQEKRFRVFQSFLPAPPLFYASSETRIIIVPLQPPFSISFHSLIIPTGMSSNRFR